MRGDYTRRDPTANRPDRVLWQHGRTVEVTPDEAERFLDLAGFADGRLDPDDRERVAEWLAGDPIAAGDVAAARGHASGAEPADPLSEPMIARAVALVAAAETRHAAIIPFPPSRRSQMMMQGLARWSSLAAAMAVASWLGFTLGVDTSLSFTRTRQAAEDGFLHEFLNPSNGFMRDLTEGSQT